MSGDVVVGPFDYAVRGEPGGVVLVARRTRIHFVREVIPDGQMAGMMGHRPEPREEEVSFEIPTRQARALLDDLAAAVAYAERQR